MYWENTNRVVSNRVVSKGPLYPSKTKGPCILNMSGAGFATSLQIWLLGTTPFDTTPFICLRPKSLAPWNMAYG